MMFKAYVMVVAVFLAALLGVGLGSATTYTFSDGTTTGNITYLIAGSETKNINIPLGVNVKTAGFYINGYNLSLGGVLAGFEDGTTGGFIDNGNTLSAVTGQGGDGSYVLKLLGTYLVMSALRFNQANASILNLSFKAKSLDPGYLMLVGDDVSAGALKGYRLAVLSNGSTALYTAASGYSAVICDPGLEWNTYGLEINNINHTVNAYCNGTRKVTDFGSWNGNPKNITSIKISGNNLPTYFDSFIASTINADYPHNVSVHVNDVVAWTYGLLNNSALDHKIFVNITSNLPQITEYPTRITFATNTTGVIEYSELYVEDFYRNFTFNFLDEADGTVFPLNDTNETILTIVCPDSQYNYSMTSGTFNVGVDCEAFELLRVGVVQNNEAYWRTLILPPSAGASPTTDWYLVDLNDKNVVQIILLLDDTSGGEWRGSSVRISKNIQNISDAIIVEQVFDSDNRVYLYLMQDEQYDLTITNSAGDVWTGQFIADSATEKTVTLPGAGFYVRNYWEQDLRVNFSFSSDNHVYSVRLLDLGNLTSTASFTVVSADNDSILYYDTYTGGFATGVQFNFVNSTLLIGNRSYVGTLRFTHDVLGVQTVEDVSGDYSGGISPGGWGDDWQTITKWFTFLILTVVILSFGQKDAHVGLAIVFILMIIFKYLGWLDYVTVVALAVLGLIAASNWWRREEVSSG